MIPDKINDAHDLLCKQPIEIQGWLHRVWSGEITPPQHFNWLVLAEVAGTYAQRNFVLRPEEASAEESLKWAEISISVYERLAQEAKDGFSFETSGMVLRAFLITKLGVKFGHPILDPSVIFAWVRKGLALPIIEVRQRAKDWKERLATGLATSASNSSVQELVSLRRIKIRLYPVKLLTENGCLQPDDEITDWLSLHSLLP
jgi:hypothetical protein